jgi:hypothetical protein
MSLQGILFLMFHYSDLMSWDIIDIILYIPIMNRQSLPTSPLFQSDPKNEKSIKSRWT